jgi:hypothetical protein
MGIWEWADNIALVRISDGVKAPTLRRAAWPVPVFIAVSLLLLPSAGAITQSGPRVTDAKYGISFRLPTTWTHLVRTTSNSGIVKLEVEDPAIAGTIGLVAVEVVPGRQINAAEVAKGILTNSGTSILGSKLVRFPIGLAEQLTFSIKTSTGPLVYGTVEGFYRNGRSYYVSVDSPFRSVANPAVKTVMTSWGQ